MKKILASILLTIFLLSILMSCSSDEIVLTNAPSTTETITAPSSTEPVISQKLQQAIDDKTFSGKTINFITTDEKIAIRSISVDRNAEDYDPDYSVNVATDKRNMLVEKDLGITINLVNAVKISNLVDCVKDNLHGAKQNIDIISANQHFNLGLAYGENSGTLLTLDQLEKEGKNYLDVSAVYWDESAYRMASLEGEHYWITGDLSQKWVSNLYVAYVNEAVWNEYSEQIEEKTGCNNIYDLVNTGKWTLDLIIWLGEKGAKAFTGISNNVFNQTAFSLYSSAGLSVTQYNQTENAPATVDFTTKEFKEFCEKIFKFYNVSEPAKNEKINEGEFASVLKTFKNGDYLVAFDTLRDGDLYLKDMEDYYIVLPLPKFYENQTRYYTTVNHDSNHFSILSTCSDPAAATATLELLGYYSYEITTPTYYSEAIRGCYCRKHKQAMDMVYIARNSIYSDYFFFWMGNIKHASSFMSALEKYAGNSGMYLHFDELQETFQQDIKEHINNLKNINP